MKTKPDLAHRVHSALQGLTIVSFLVAPNAFAWPDMTVSKTGPASAVAGDTIAYTLTYTNKGAITASSVVLTDVLPADLIPVSNSLGNGTLNGNTITWNLGSIAAKKGGRLTFQAQVNASAAGHSITNWCSIYTPTAESNTNNNSAKAITCILPARQR